MYGCLMEVIGYFCACVKATWIMYFVLIIPSRVWVCVVCLWLVVCVCVSLNGYMTNLASLMFVSTISEAFAWLQSYSPKFGPMRFAKTQWSTSAKVLTFHSSISTDSPTLHFKSYTSSTLLYWSCFKADWPLSGTDILFLFKSSLSTFTSTDIFSNVKLSALHQGIEACKPHVFSQTQPD